MTADQARAMVARMARERNASELDIACETIAILHSTLVALAGDLAVATSAVLDSPGAAAMTPRSHDSQETIDGRVINRLRARYPYYTWRYCMRRRFDALWPTYEASCIRQRRTVTWFTVGDQSAWRWTDSREPALPVGSAS